MKKTEKEFLSALAGYSMYWANIPVERLEPASFETIEEARTNGLIHSILVLLRGDSGANDFKPYRIQRGKSIIGEDEYLPSRYFETFKKVKGVE